MTDREALLFRKHKIESIFSGAGKTEEPLFPMMLGKRWTRAKTPSVSKEVRSV
jgi:hypothetical protein